MAKCSYCQRSSPFLRTNSHGLCKRCRADVRSKAAAKREEIKGDLISARFLKDSDKKVHHLRRALDGTQELFRYEKLGCPQLNPSPKALKTFLEGKLQEAAAVQKLSEGETNHTGQMSPAPADARAATGSQSRPLDSHSDLGMHGPRAWEDGGAPGMGTRRARRHPAKFGVWMDRAIRALTEDISSHGLCVRSVALLKPGTRVGVTLEVPDGQVSGEGMVRWAQRSGAIEYSTSQAIMGVEFLAPPPELRRYA